MVTLKKTNDFFHNFEFETMSTYIKVYFVNVWSPHKPPYFHLAFNPLITTIKWRRFYGIFVHEISECSMVFMLHNYVHLIDSMTCLIDIIYMLYAL